MMTMTTRMMNNDEEDDDDDNNEREEDVDMDEYVKEDQEERRKRRTRMGTARVRAKVGARVTWTGSEMEMRLLDQICRSGHIWGWRQG